MSGTGQPYFLRTTRLGFRQWRHEDTELALALWGDHAVTANFDARGPWSHADVSRRLREEIAAQTTHGMQYWPVFLLADDTHVGCCGLTPCDPETHILELGFHLRRNCWGRGLALEAARGVVACAFDTLGASALFAGHNPSNGASRTVLTRLGFTYTHDELYPPSGKLHRSYLLRAEEWAGHTP